MSNPGILSKLKSVVEVYEKELQEATKAFDHYSAQPLSKENALSTERTTGIMMTLFSRVIDVYIKLANAYREYTKELEKLVPR